MRRRLGPNHPAVSKDLNNLASLYRYQGKIEQAEPLFRRSLAIAEKTLGPEHPDVAAKLSNLAGLLREEGKYSSGRAYVQARYGD
jgi:tetratricopeptide (TPR) repeat protein